MALRVDAETVTTNQSQAPFAYGLCRLYTQSATVLTESRRNVLADSPESHDAIPIATLLGILGRRLWVILLVASTIVGVVVGLSLQQKPQYVASVQILVGQDGGIVGTSANDAMGLQSLALTMAEAVLTQRVAEATVQQLDLKADPEYVLEQLSAEQVPETQLVEVSYTGSDPKKAALVANTVGKVFSDQISEVNSGDNAVNITATVWETATVPDAPVSPNPLRNGFLALVVGVMLGVGLAFLLEFLDDRWQSPEEAERISGVPTLGVVPPFASFNTKVMKQAQEGK